MISSPSASVVSADIVFHHKGEQRFFVFVPGEDVSGTAYVRLTQPRPFKCIHVEVLGLLQMKHLFNPTPDPKQKKSALPVEETLIEERVVTRFGHRYPFKYGEDKTKSVTVSFGFTVPPDALPSFAWKGGESRPNAVSCGELRYELLVWLEVDDAPPPLPPAGLSSKRLPLTLIPCDVSAVAGGPKVAARPGAAAPVMDVSFKHKSGVEMTVRLSERVFVLAAPADPPVCCGVTVNVDNRSKKSVDGITFALEEITTVRLGPKPTVYRRLVALSRPDAPVFVDKNNGSATIKHAVPLTTPRPPDSGIENFFVESPWLSVRHELTARLQIKGIKVEDMTTPPMPVVVWPMLPERRCKEHKL